MSAPVFVDSNIWLYGFIVADESKHKGTLKLLEKTLKESSVMISIQVVNEVCCGLKKNDFSEKDIRSTIDYFFKSCVIITPSYDILLEASDLRRKHRFSFWDSLILSSAIRGNCVYLYTEDMQDGMSLNGLTIVNPFQSRDKSSPA